MDSSIQKFKMLQQWDRDLETTLRNTAAMQTQTQEQATTTNPLTLTPTTTNTQSQFHTPTPPPPTFHPFPLLPFELRSLIWDHLIPIDERIIPIRYHTTTRHYTSRTIAPVILHINAESRSHGKKIYQEVMLGSQIVTGAYIDMSRDTLYLCADLGWLSTSETKASSRAQLAQMHWQKQQHASRIWDDLSRGPGVDMPDLRKRLVTCAEMYGLLMWTLFVPWRRKLAPRIDRWDVVCEDGGKGMFRVEELRENPEMEGWVVEDRDRLKMLDRSTKKLNLVDVRNGRPLILDFKLTYLHWSRSN
ncbi:hypothetical protein ONS95_014290 [Cadophora gregata]|uniref:uncharacterized protein n=1 Tax=Cadophora gregata TaxID=51156 RepID=UPI0026DDCACF|nr:uncharacterized protein ONS95_014290 [Cadophora gregata]KAK0114809.1 hypothetical protein ONS95_014290 [Cadophora gregata]